MTTAFLHATGGLGLFLLGMTIMTEGLRALAGDALRRFLARFTSSPVSGVATGVVATAIVQSSSATTVAAVGFAGAGLLTFPQALGVILGANLGTTVTGWIVTLVGFKLKLGVALLPVLLAGALLRLFGRRGGAATGGALAGFGLLFVGIDMLQVGMGSLEGWVTPASFPPDTWFGRLSLVGIGIAITLVTQSSSAGVATALAAVSTGTIGLAQAAALVIGMDVGTTVTAMIASVGGSVAARRTGLAHVVYNLMTAAGAFLLVGPYLDLCDAWASNATSTEPEILLVGFHTGFNVLGVLAILPFVRRFARLLEWAIPERPSEIARRLDRSLTTEPAVAIDAVDATVRETAAVTAAELVALLGGERDVNLRRLDEVDVAVDEVRRFVSKIEVANDRLERRDRLVAALHVVDHVDRLLERLREGQRLEAARGGEELAAIVSALVTALRDTRGPFEDEEAARRTWRLADDTQEPFRHGVLSAAANQSIDAESALARLDGVRALRRTSYHVWRIAHHLRRLSSTLAGAPTNATSERFEVERTGA